MRKLRQALRLAWEVGLSLRPIGRSLGLSPTTVGEYLRRAEIAGLTWPLPPQMMTPHSRRGCFREPLQSLCKSARCQTLPQ